MDIDMEQIDTKTVAKEEQHQYDFVEQIERAYDWNAARLTEMILNECQLVNRLRSLNKEIQTIIINKKSFLLLWKKNDKITNIYITDILLKI